MKQPLIKVCKIKERFPYNDKSNTFLIFSVYCLAKNMAN
jgi:hypothetical protein